MWALLCFLLASAAPARAQEGGPDSPPASRAHPGGVRAEGTGRSRTIPEDPGFGAGTAPAEQTEEDAEGYGATARVRGAPREHGDRAGSVVTRRQLEERLPRSAPDALRYEPGVYVQQTAHGQASPYVRGMTGQQVVHLFDGVRLNNGIYRQGPNQYFFTVDARTLHSLEVVRGSASTRYGSDALGGAILAEPRAPFVDPQNRGLDPRLRLYARRTSADDGWGGRAELEARIGPRTAVLAGAGYRDVDLLRSGGVVGHRRDATGSGEAMRGTIAPWVPRFAEEADHPGDPGAWRTQLGTGFREATFDGRLVHALGRDLRLVAAAYAYRQLDAPRTDKCPPPEAPVSECLLVDEQFRTLAYGALRGDAGAELRDLDVTLSYQKHHELRRQDRPRSFVSLDWADDVHTVGASVRGSSRRLRLGEGGRWRLSGGADAYADFVESEASQTFTDIDRDFALSRGQYLDGSRYVHGGVWVEAEAWPTKRLAVRSGGRVAFARVDAPADPESGTAAIDRGFGAAVGRAGLEWQARPWISLLLNLDRGFRAPNLDDLTSRQQTGPGFQFENAELEPERTTTVEAGVAVDLTWLRIDAWSFVTLLESGIERAVREAGDCPPMTPQCPASRNQFQLVNAGEDAVIVGAEGGATAYLPAGFTVRATASWAWGEGPNTGARPGDPSFEQERVPLSRIPPLNGTLEGRWRDLETGLYAAAALRWAFAQGRLAPADRFDARIPLGGTPGYAVVDLRAGIRRGDRLRLSLVLENLFDAAWRAHGSSVNGPGRGFLLEGMLGF